MTASYPSVHFDGENSGYISDCGRAQRTREQFNIVWSYEPDGGLRASPVVSDEVVLFGDMDGVVYGLDAIDGREHWRTNLDAASIFASPAVADETVFISGYDDLNRSNSTTAALDLATGEVQWERDFGQGGRTPVTTDGERVYVQTYDGDCHALATGTGETVWHVDGQRHNKVPALSDGLLILKDGESFVALDTTSGTEQWRADLDGRVLTPPVLDADRVYAVVSSSELWCLDRGTGEKLWHVEIGKAIRDQSDTDDPILPLAGSALHSKPVTDGASLVVGIYEGLVKIDATDGRVLSYCPLGQRVRGSLLIGGNDESRLYGHVQDNGLTEFQITSDGPSSLRSAVPEALDMTPAYAAGVFYVSTELNGVFAVV